jgi:hypothetical protein
MQRGHDLDQPDERPDEQPVVQADEVEAGRQNSSDREHHQESGLGSFFASHSVDAFSG